MFVFIVAYFGKALLGNRRNSSWCVFVDIQIHKTSLMTIMMMLLGTMRVTMMTMTVTVMMKVTVATVMTKS